MKPNVLEMPIHNEGDTIVVTFTAVDGLIVVRVNKEYVDTITNEEIPIVLEGLDFILWENELDPTLDITWTCYDLTEIKTGETHALDLGRYLPAILEWARTQPALNVKH